MNPSRLIFFAIVILLSACVHKQKHVVSAIEELIPVDSTLDAMQDTAYLRYLQPYADSLNSELDIVIGYAPVALTIRKPECSMLNWACDALYDMAVEKTHRQVDFSVVNIGGMRSEWQAGDIAKRHIFCLMPFDNRLVLLTMQGSDVLELCDVFAQQGGQGVSRQLRMEIVDGKAGNVRLKGGKIIPEAVYYIATSNYLATGADRLTPLSHYVDIYDSNLLIRDLYMEYVQTRKQVKSTVDGRMKKL